MEDSVEVQRFQFKEFEDVNELAMGAEGSVFSGRHKSFKSTIAIKRFHNPRKIECEREISILTRTPSHENIIKLRGLIVNDRNLTEGLIMDFMERGSLHKVIYIDKLIYDSKLICRWIIGISKGIQHLHDCEVIHRDIKPNNLMIGQRLAMIKIGDYGHSRTISNGSYSADRGTSLYMAPEITLGGYDQKVDVYSLCITINEIYSRRLPYSELQNTSDFLRTQAIVNYHIRPKISQDIPSDLLPLIKNGWNHHASRRPELSAFIEVAEQIKNGTLPSTPADDITVMESEILLNNSHQYPIQVFPQRLNDIIFTERLYSVIHGEDNYSHKDVFEWGRKLACALHFLHNNGIIHRDIKPKNILLKVKWKTLKITDFARHPEQKKGKKGTLLISKQETYNYMAPEICSQDYSTASDISSLAITLDSEMAHRKSPHKDSLTFLQIKETNSIGIRLPREDLNEMVINLLKRGWDKDTNNQPKISKFLSTTNQLTKDPLSSSTIPPPKSQTLTNEEMTLLPSLNNSHSVNKMDRDSIELPSIVQNLKGLNLVSNSERNIRNQSSSKLDMDLIHLNISKSVLYRYLVNLEKEEFISTRRKLKQFFDSTKQWEKERVAETNCLVLSPRGASQKTINQLTNEIMNSQKVEEGLELYEIPTIIGDFFIYTYKPYHSLKFLNGNKVKSRFLNKDKNNRKSLLHFESLPIDSNLRSSLTIIKEGDQLQPGSIVNVLFAGCKRTNVPIFVTKSVRIFEEKGLNRKFQQNFKDPLPFEVPIQGKKMRFHAIDKNGRSLLQRIQKKLNEIHILCLLVNVDSIEAEITEVLRSPSIGNIIFVSYSEQLQDKDQVSWMTGGIIKVADQKRCCEYVSRLFQDIKNISLRKEYSI